MKIAILGYARQGQSAAEYYSHDKNNEITICDIKENIKLPKNYQKKLGKTYLDNLDEFDLIVRSPSIHPNNIVKSNDTKILEKVTTTTNIFFEVCPTKNIIGVTGTKGKGTTSTLISKMLEKAGYRVHLGGNIGLDPLQLLKENIKAQDWVVLELANFQLIDIKYSPKIAICLMTTPEHQDWHESIEEYYQAKSNLFRYQKQNDLAIYNGNYKSSEFIASISPAKKHLRFDVPLIGNPPKNTEAAFVKDDSIYYKNSFICKEGDIALLGRHNLENACAAISAIWEISKNNLKAITDTLNSFSGMKHRLEFVSEINQVKYYNDSFATTPEATIAAIRAFNKPIVIILGGSFKGVELNQVVDEVLNSTVKWVVAIGDSADYFVNNLIASGFNNISKIETNMNDIVEEATKRSTAGDVVLLSTACASFGMFENYEDRGNQFKQVVNSLNN
jgi:UDP-N-acetylmuramoylalanine--D-glutamate ligase